MKIKLHNTPFYILLYKGHNNFDHQRLAKLLKKYDKEGLKWVLSYSDCKLIRELYQEFNIYEESWNYSMNPKGGKKSHELVITNFKK